MLDPLVVCGPSGVGKGSIITKFMNELGGGSLFGFTVSHTTRNPRPGEIHGIHYHFVDMDIMEEEKLEKQFVDVNDGFCRSGVFVDGLSRRKETKERK